MPLGITGEAAYSDQPLVLAPGDLLLLLTDGITESRAGREFFGMDGVEQVLTTLANTNHPLPQIGEHIVGAARTFGGGAFRDDVCLLLARLQP